jgi:hypothetical protein
MTESALEAFDAGDPPPDLRALPVEQRPLSSNLAQLT